MSGLLDKAEVPAAKLPASDPPNDWETSMLAQIKTIREAIRERDPAALALRSGTDLKGGQIFVTYWGSLVLIDWPDLTMRSPNGDLLSIFDTAMLTYYLHFADGTAMGDHWIGFRELPDGAFYNQAFQGYSGNRLAKTFGDDPETFDRSASKLGGMRLAGLTDHAYAFLPLPRIRIAGVLWPGDEEIPSKASVLFDSASHHYLPTDGLALLGSGLTGRLIKVRDVPHE